MSQMNPKKFLYIYGNLSSTTIHCRSLPLSLKKFFFVYIWIYNLEQNLRNIEIISMARYYEQNIKDFNFLKEFLVNLKFCLEWEIWSFTRSSANHPKDEVELFKNIFVFFFLPINQNQPILNKPLIGPCS